MADDIEKKLLKYLKDVGKKKVEVNGGKKMSRLEALALITWKEALGYYVETEVPNGEGEVEIVRTWVAPDRFAKQIIFDHLLGKPKPKTAKSTDKKAKAPPAHKMVGKELSNRINGIIDDGKITAGREPEATVKESVPERKPVLEVQKNRSSSAQEIRRKLRMAKKSFNKGI